MSSTVINEINLNEENVWEWSAWTNQTCIADVALTFVCVNSTMAKANKPVTQMGTAVFMMMNTNNLKKKKMNCGIDPR